MLLPSDKSLGYPINRIVRVVFVFLLSKITYIVWLIGTVLNIFLIATNCKAVSYITHVIDLNTLSINSSLKCNV